MKEIFGLMILTALLAGASLAQKNSKPVEQNAAATANGKNAGKVRARKPPAKIDESRDTVADVLKRGAAVGRATKISLADVLKTPEKFADKTVFVEGVIVRSCKKEGCWMELAPVKEAESVRVTFKDHAFFVPLDAAGMRAKAEGVFKIKTLSKAEVEHLVKEDGAKFDNVNQDGTVTEIAFEATGVELSKPTK